MVREIMPEPISVDDVFVKERFHGELWRFLQVVVIECREWRPLHWNRERAVVWISGQIIKRDPNLNFIQAAIIADGNRCCYNERIIVTIHELSIQFCTH